ncbi:MAG TPA: hypothetical protein VGO62_06805, partial [Myxococcota bacterium]
MLGALAALVALALPVAGARPTCDVDGAGHIQKRVKDVVPTLEKGRFQKLFTGLRAVDPNSVLDVDERHITFTLVGDKPLPALHLPLALPAPWSGFVDVTARPVEGRFCAHTEAVVFDTELRQVSVDGLPLDLAVTVVKKEKGAVARTFSVKQDGLVFTQDTVVARAGDAGEMRLYVGDGPPGDDSLEVDGADLYLKSLSALDPGIVDDIRAHPSPQAERVLFAELAAQLRSSLPQWSPKKRLDAIARFEVKDMPSEIRPLLHFWKTELGVRTAAPKGALSAHIIIDDAVQALWL